ncbi:hypothetical protein NQ317_019278 [Molorchus minor]|uniref:Uncharacterized protein n=1 Tax=Molorchus minor TaxID=1323400 RepID=A0ABQ9JY38_9CUCU|nr:hypothetical protein NQ317_019278 [Molorchus minor]
MMRIIRDISKNTIVAVVETLEHIYSKVIVIKQILMAHMLVCFPPGQAPPYARGKQKKGRFSLHTHPYVAEQVGVSLLMQKASCAMKNTEVCRGSRPHHMLQTEEEVLDIVEDDPSEKLHVR